MDKYTNEYLVIHIIIFLEKLADAIFYIIPITILLIFNNYKAAIVWFVVYCCAVVFRGIQENRRNK